MAFDATSLYPSAMVQRNDYPDLDTVQHFKLEDIKTYRHYILNCDIHLPEHLTFVPVPSKENGACFYKTGHIYNQYYNDVDIAEIYRFGGQITKIHSGIAFTGSIKSPFQDFVNKYFNLRQKYKNEGKKTLDLACKLILNSCYGKTVQKDILTKVKFTTQEKFKEKYDSSIIEYMTMPNG